MTNSFFDIAKLGGDYAQIVSDIALGKKVSCFGVGMQERALISCALGQKVLYIAPDLVQAKKIFETVAGNKFITYFCRKL